jgi:hypothetical protein
MNNLPSSIATQFGFVQPITLSKFIDQLAVEQVTEFTYFRVNQIGFDYFENKDPEVSDFERVEPETSKFTDIWELKNNIEEDIKKNIERKGEVQFLDEVLLPHVENFGELTHLVLLPNGLAMPANLGDFRILIGKRKGDTHSAFCWFNSKRFFCYKFDFEKFMKEIGA